MSKKTRLTLLARGGTDNADVAKTVRLILKKVSSGGDAAIKKLVLKFNKTKIKSLKVSEDEIFDAYRQVQPEVIDALKQAKRNLEKVCIDQLKSLNNVQRKVETEKGIYVWREWRPIEKIGLYAPGGKAVYPSSVIMAGVPAMVAGCKDIILCTPPNSKGNLSPLILVAADLVGIKQIFKVGGAEAIGSMAYGTETIPKVSKIIGPGNQFVAEAKKQVLDSVSIDSPAGPSEVFIIADKDADPYFIAADLLADGEHGDNSSCILITTSEAVAKETIKQIKMQLKPLSTSDRIMKSLKSFGLIAVADTLDEAINFCNDFAPEHVELMIENPENYLPKIMNAGSVFLGKWTAKASGDYVNGANHILPTGGFAKMYAPLSVESFGLLMEVQNVSTKISLARVRESAEILGELEGLPAHRESISVRFRKR